MGNEMRPRSGALLVCARGAKDTTVTKVTETKKPRSPGSTEWNSTLRPESPRLIYLLPLCPLFPSVSLFLT